MENNKSVAEGNKKVLISIRNLKQYFPVKGSKKEFVRANDGITLDIYEGETLGIVGESGCGKSTLGRVLLQLYHQTEGETMYYGIDRDAMAPAYVAETFKNLESNIKKSAELREKANKLAKEYEELEKKTNTEDHDEVNKLYNLQAELNNANKEAHNAFLNIAELIGGFYSVGDCKTVSAVFLEHYKACERLSQLNSELKKLNLDKEDFLIRAAEENRSRNKYLSKAEENERKIQIKNEEIEQQKTIVKQKAEIIDDLRKQYSGDPDFQAYEKYRDAGINLARLNYNEMRKLRSELQLIFQDPYSSLNPRFTIGQIIGEGLITHQYFKRHSDVMQESIIKTMEECGLQPYMIHRYPHQFSGGQRQRIGIARSLAVHPKFVVCDEAVSALDVSIQSQVINLLKDLKEKENLTYMFISHDLSVVKYISDRIAVMYLGNIVELASSERMFQNPLHPYTEALLSAIPTTDEVKEQETLLLEGDIPSPIKPPSGCKFHTRCIHCMDICRVVVPEFIEVEEEHFVACHYVSQRQ